MGGDFKRGGPEKKGAWEFKIQTSGNPMIRTNTNMYAAILSFSAGITQARKQK